MKRIKIGTIAPSLEAIDFQSDNFGKEIEIAFQSMFESYSTAREARESKECKNIEKLIAMRTGVNVTLVLETNIIAAVHAPGFHENHIFIQNNQRDLWKKHRDLSSNKNNYANFIKSITQTSVDLKNA
jgi:vacuolar-type H+-ATPase subunit D/Vma8